MNIERTFARVLKAHAKGEDVTVVTNYARAAILLKYILAYPDTHVCCLELESVEADGYSQAFLLSLDADGTVFCEKAISSITGEVKCGDGLYLIDVSAVGSHAPEEFLLYDGQKFKLIGGEDHD